MPRASCPRGWRPRDWTIHLNTLWKIGTERTKNAYLRYARQVLRRLLECLSKEFRWDILTFKLYLLPDIFSRSVNVFVSALTRSSDEAFDHSSEFLVSVEKNRAATDTDPMRDFSCQSAWRACWLGVPHPRWRQWTWDPNRLVTVRFGRV